MKITNKSDKVIFVNNNMLLPDNSISLTRVQADTPAIKALAAKGMLAVEDDVARWAHEETPAAEPASDKAEEPSTEEKETTARKPRRSKAETETA